MKKLLYIMGKSSSGKDTIKKALISQLKINSSVTEIIPYTTRDIRVGEKDGVDYFFVGEDQYIKMMQNNEIVEDRLYQKVQGPVRYFTVINENILESNSEYLISIGTLESYQKIKQYINKMLNNKLEICPIYLEVEASVRLARAGIREEKEVGENQNFDEIRRRYAADEIDFSNQNLLNAGIDKKFINNDVENTINEIIGYLNLDMSK